MTEQEPVGPEDQVARQRSRGDETGSDGYKPFPIVGIGASAGGLEALSQLLAALPEHSGMSFLVVQHLDPHHESKLSELLDRVTALPVEEASHGAEVRADCVYVIPPNVNMAIAQGTLRLTPRAEDRRPHLPVDYLFRSLAEDQQARAIGVVLSGTGSDGTLGLCEIKAVGGITFAQEEQSARHGGMPRSAIDSGCVDFVLTPESIARRLAEVKDHPYLAPEPAGRRVQPDVEDQYRKVLGIVRSATGVDFSMYRDTTIKRRIMRRMALHTQQSWDEYLKRLRGDRAEVDALYHDLLINVTSFFRDPELFEALKVTVFPELIKDRPPSAPIRVWVPGCSTGQEAYSIAIALLEFFDDKPARPPFQIFATDLSDQTALDKARVGIFPDSIEAEVSAERLRRFFRREDHVYRIDKSIRDMCVFARQNVTSDPPFSHLDIISCRNVLIYLSTALQKRVLPTFHYSLNVPGFLVLGSAESIGENTDLFEIVDRSNRIYSKKATASRLPMMYSTDAAKVVESIAARRFPASGPAPADYQREADRVLLGRYSPAGVLVNENFDILQFRGTTSEYLESPSGEPTTSILKMAREGLFLELRSALNEARKTHLSVRREGLHVHGDGRVRETSLEVVPIRPPGTTSGCYLILFHDAVNPAPAAVQAMPEDRSTASSNDRVVVQLQQELAATKEYLQSLVEQQDAANEELRSANEEILSSNEELQSTNEELETAKEELQSANEELTTVNEQLQHRNLELTQVNNDLTNLMSSTNIPVVMVGGDLRIRRFTAPARKMMSLLPTDIGRPIGDIKPALIVPDIEAIIVEVIDSVQPHERVVQEKDGRWLSLRVHPYRTQDHKIDGAVLLLVDIDEQKRAEDSLRTADRRKDEFLATLAHELRNPISPIVNAIEIMRLAENDPATVARARDVLYRQAHQLSRIVEDLIDVSRIVEKKVELKRQRVELADIVETAIESCRSQIEGRHQSLRVHLPPDPVVIDADPVRISQVLINLLNNAIKFTGTGGEISLTAEVKRERGPTRGDPRRLTTPRKSYLVIRLKDAGAGIAPDFLPRIFDIFTQETRQDQNIGGLGVGLSLVRALVEMHGGVVDAFSEGIDRGSEFVIRLPLPVDAATTAQPAREKPVSSTTVLKRRILVVDDNEDQAQSLGMLLNMLGHETHVAYDGPSAVAEAIKLRPDIALVDIGIPGINGYEVARQLRERPDFDHVVLVAQTGWGHDKDRARSQEAGFDYHLVKPLDLAELQRILAESGSAAEPA